VSRAKKLLHSSHQAGIISPFIQFLLVTFLVRNYKFSLSFLVKIIVMVLWVFIRECNLKSVALMDME